ncbi:hypothetical protein BDD12DRAFT_822299 [Trichophaea hybrida]|nr:hypothetical protein BDD12DRAFT_822299 [Trichophaea hybrida]
MVRHCKLSCARRYASQKGFRWCCCRRQLIVSISNGAEHCYKHGSSSDSVILCNASYEAEENGRLAGIGRAKPSHNNHAVIMLFLLLLHL